ncbi:MAG: Y+L amino acid transporter [Icmadophila ericetorum]|nr:Y+L amino acid transporter [Icmadophila ericetorum]
MATIRTADSSIPLHRYALVAAATEDTIESPTSKPKTSVAINENNDDEEEDANISPTASLRSSLDLDAYDPAIQPPHDLLRPKGSLTYLNGLALILGLQIGSGIFSAPSQVSRHVPSPGTAISVWLIAGLLVWTGAASFIELGIAIPDNGGIQEYLRTCYGDFAGFLFSWIWITIAKPSAIAMIAMIFAENLGTVISTDADSGLLATWKAKIIAILGIQAVTFVNCLGSRTGAQAANGFLVLKLLAISSIGITGLVIGTFGLWKEGQKPDTAWFGKDPDPLRQQFPIWVQVGEYVTAVYGALFCYGGWESLGFVAGEMTNPGRDLPRAIISAMTIAVSGFFTLNVALYVVLPFTGLRERSTVAVDFGQQVFGLAGKLGYSLIVSASCLGSLNSNVFATGRLCAAASKREYLPAVLSNLHCSTRDQEPQYNKTALRRFPSRLSKMIAWFAAITGPLRWEKNVPIYAMVMNASIASFYVLIGTFDSLVTFVGISEYFFFLLSVMGLFILRRNTDSTSQYRTWTINPVTFCLVSGFLVVRGLLTDPLQGAALFTLIAIGWLIFRLRFRLIDNTGGT